MTDFGKVIVKCHPNIPTGLLGCELNGALVWYGNIMNFLATEVDCDTILVNKYDYEQIVRKVAELSNG